MSLLEQFQKEAGVQAPAMPAMQQAQKNDPTGSPVGPYNHGQNGIFYLPYSNNRLVSTLIMPRGGLMDVLPVLDSDPYESPQSNMFGGRVYDYDTIMTGLTAGDLDDFDNQPTTDCADGPVGGLAKLCTQINTMARYRGGTREVSLFRAGQAYNRLDEMSHSLLNQSEALRGFFGMPENMPAQNDIIMNEAARRMFEALVSFRRMFAQRIWIGSPANNSGEKRDILGLQTQVNTGKKDVFQNILCPAADSIVRNFNFNAAEGGGALDIVDEMESIEYVNQINADRMGLGPVDGVLVMREEIFYALTNVWPVKQYQAVIAALAAQNGGDRTRMTIDATGAARERNTFRTSKMLPLNGKMYRVVIDDGIPQLNSTNSASVPAGSYASDIYFIPTTVMGGMPATFFQYFNHDNRQAQGLLERIPGNNSFTFTSDGGSFRWYINFKNGCLTLNFEFSPWLKMKVPMVAWRLTNVKVTPNLMARDFDPASSYFANGGSIGNNQSTNEVIYPGWAESSQNI